MSVIDEKQEAIACIRMAVDNNNLAQLDADDELDPEIDNALQHWQLGSPEGKKSNLRVMSAELGREHEEYRCLDERVRDFIACHMPEEAMRFEDDIHVSLFTIDQRVLCSFSTLHRFSGTNVSLLNTSQRLTGQRQKTFYAAILIFMVNDALIVLLFMMMPLGSRVLVLKAYFAAGFHLERLSILHLFMDSLAANGNPGHYGRVAGYWMKTELPL
jgi:hypothetical protein